MVFRVCEMLRAIIVRAMLLALVGAVLGGMLLVMGLLFGAFMVVSTSTSLSAALAAIFAHPMFGRLAFVGLVLLTVGLLLVFLLLTVYVLVTVVCCSLAADTANKKAPAGCDCGSLCLLGPLFPAAAFLTIVLFITPLLFFSMGRFDLGAAPDSLLSTATWLLALFGLLLVIAPVIWCCCRACNCKDEQSGGGVILGAPPSAPRLDVDPSETPRVDLSENT